MVSRSLRTRRAISASSTHKMTGRIESGGKGLIWLHPLDETTILHAARELNRKVNLALCRNLEKWPIGGDLKFWPRRLVVEVGLPGCKPESSGDERREMVWKWGRAWCVPARSVVSTPRRRC